MLSSIFSYIRSKFYSLAYYFSYIGNWLDARGSPWTLLAPYFYSARDLTHTIGNYFYDAYQAARTVESLLDDAWTKAKQAFDYAYEVLTDKVNDAWDLANDAFDYAYDVLRRRVNDALDLADDAFDYAYTAYKKARDAWDYATDYLKGLVTDAYNKAVWAFDQIAVAVTAASQDIYAWVKAIPAEIRDFVDGVLSDIGAVTVTIVETLIAAALAVIAGPINLVNLWFDDIQAFFTSPLDWLESKLADWFLGPEQ